MVPMRLMWVAALCALVVACGGGGGGVGEGGTGAIASGPITGFGSIIVGGVRYDDSSASVSDDDHAVRRSDELRLGMVVTIEATPIDAATLTARALTIRIAGEVAGPLEAVDAVARTLRVFGQRVGVTTYTAFDDRLAAGLAGLRVGDPVQVYGYLDRARGLIVATRIEPYAVASATKLRGPIEAIDTVARTITVGGQTVSTTVVALPSGLAVGGWALQRVELSGGILRATRIEASTLHLDERQEARLEGRVTAFTSQNSFSIDGVAVDGNGVASGVALGERVEVEGTVVAGVVVASRVSVHDAAGEEIRLRGALANPSAAARSFVVRGVTVLYGSATAFENGSAADLLAGRAVDVRATLAADGVRVQALRIKFE